MRRGAPALSAAGKPAEPGDRSCKDAAALTADSCAHRRGARGARVRAALPLAPSERCRAPRALPESAPAAASAPALVLAPEANRESTGAARPGPHLERAELEGSQSDARLDDDHDEGSATTARRDFGLDDSELAPTQRSTKRRIRRRGSLAWRGVRTGGPDAERADIPVLPARRLAAALRSFNATLRARQEQSKEEEKDERRRGIARRAAARAPPACRGRVSCTRRWLAGTRRCAPKAPRRCRAAGSAARRRRGDATPPLQFESRFECGNLWRAERHIKVDAPPKPRTSSDSAAPRRERRRRRRARQLQAAALGRRTRRVRSDPLGRPQPETARSRSSSASRARGSARAAPRQHREQPQARASTRRACAACSGRGHHRMNGTGWRRGPKPSLPNVCMRTTSARPKRQRCYLPRRMSPTRATCFLAYHFPSLLGPPEDLAALGVGPRARCPRHLCRTRPPRGRAGAAGRPTASPGTRSAAPPPPRGLEPDGATSMACAHRSAIARRSVAARGRRTCSPSPISRASRRRAATTTPRAVTVRRAQRAVHPGETRELMMRACSASCSPLGRGVLAAAPLHLQGGADAQSGWRDPWPLPHEPGGSI